MLEGKNVILQAPTGSGKTRAALFPFLLAREENFFFPRKLLYCVPMRVLARSFYDALKDNGLHVSSDIRLQTGEQQDDRWLKGEIIFSTIDQVISSFLNIPYSLSMRQANINAGAVVTSYLVLDEFHLLDPGSTLPTTLEMLRMLKGITPFLLMTATFSAEMLKRIGNLLNAEVVKVLPDELRFIPSQKSKERKVYRKNDFLNAEAVLEHHQDRSIVICNTVERAQALYNTLRTKVESKTKLILLHSRFLKSDRRKIEDKILLFFGKKRKKEGNVILVATQVIEVGLDITCNVMHTELAPASALIQRAGRCARFEGEKGKVFVYRLPLNKKGETNYAPYFNHQKELCERTWEALDECGKNMDFIAEQQLVNIVHTSIDAQMLSNLEQASYIHRKKIEKAVAEQEIGFARELIRNDDSIHLLVGSNPEQIENPFNMEGFSIFRGTIYKKFDSWIEEGWQSKLTWILKYPRESNDVEGDNFLPNYDWCKVEDQRGLRCSPIYVINPLLVYYDSEIGFCFRPGGGFESPLKELSGKLERQRQWCYFLETYEEHIVKMISIYCKKILSEFIYALTNLEKQLKLPPGTLDLAIRLAIAFHDFAKMNILWQQWSHEWQKLIGKEIIDDYMVAHTDYNPDNHLYQSVKLEMSRKKPSHAAESAVAALKIIYHVLGSPSSVEPGWKIVKAVFTAITRHHSPKTDSYKSFTLHPASRSVAAWILENFFNKIYKQAVQDLELNKKEQSIDSLLVRSSSQDELLAYFLIVRALRLADQEAMERKEKE